MKLLRKVNKVWVAVSATTLVAIMVSNQTVQAEEINQSQVTSNQVEKVKSENDKVESQGTKKNLTLFLLLPLLQLLLLLLLLNREMLQMKLFLKRQLTQV